MTNLFIGVFRKIIVFKSCTTPWNIAQYRIIENLHQKFEVIVIMCFEVLKFSGTLNSVKNLNAQLQTLGPDQHTLD